MKGKDPEVMNFIKDFVHAFQLRELKQRMSGLWRPLHEVARLVLVGSIRPRSIHRAVSASF